MNQLFELQTILNGHNMLCSKMGEDKTIILKIFE